MEVILEKQLIQINIDLLKRIKELLTKRQPELKTKHRI